MPEETFNAVDKDYFHKRYGILLETYYMYQITFNKYITKLDDLKVSFDQFIISHNQYKKLIKKIF